MSLIFSHFFDLPNSHLHSIFIFIALLEYCGSLICARIWIALLPSISLATIQHQRLAVWTSHVKNIIIVLICIMMKVLNLCWVSESLRLHIFSIVKWYLLYDSRNFHLAMLWVKLLHGGNRSFYVFSLKLSYICVVTLTGVAGWKLKGGVDNGQNELIGEMSKRRRIVRQFA